MFGTTSPFGQSTAGAFGSQSPFGQNNVTNNPFAPKPFGTTNPFGSQTGSSIFGNTSTGVFGQSSSPLSSTPVFGASSSPAFGSSTPAFGSSSSSFGGSSVFGQNKPAFGGFGSSTQASPFGSSFQQSQPAFGSNMFGSTSPFGAASQPAFGSTSTPAFGSSTTAAFGATSTPAFGSTPSPTFGSTGTAFGVSSTPAFGSTSTPVFGASSTPAFGATSTPAFGATSTPAFGATSTPAFGATSSTPAFGATSTPAFGSSTPAFGASSTPSFSFGSSPAFGQSASAFGSSPFGATSSPFGAQSSPFGAQATTPTFGSGGFGQSPLGGQPGGSRVVPYSPTTEADSGSSTQPAGKLESISAMPAYKDKSHEELRWEDYQRGDKGGPNPAGQSSVGIGFGTSTPQSSPFGSSTFGQTASNPFSSTVQSNPFAPKPAGFGATGFGATSTPAFSSSPFGSTTTSSPFGSTSAPTTSIFGSSTPAFGAGTSPSLFGAPSSSAIGSTSLFGSTPTQGTGTSFGSTLSFGNTQSSPLFQSSTPSLGQTGSAFGQTGSSFGQTGGFGQSSIFNTPSTGFGGNLFSSSSSFASSSQLGFGQTTPSLSTPFQSSLPTQTSSPFNFSSFGQTQSAGVGAFGGGSSIFGQNLGQMPTNQTTPIAQPVAVTNPFGTLPAMPQMSIGNTGTSPSIQYGISSMPVVDKPNPVKISSLLTSRHVSQRRIRLPARKYHPKSNGSRVPFFSDEDEATSTPKADALFVPRENPRALVIRPVDQWPSKSSTKEPSAAVHENGKTSKDGEHPLNGSLAGKEKISTENGSVKENNQPVKPSQKPTNESPSLHKCESSSPYITLSGHRAGEAAIVYEHGADIEAMMPKLRHSDYYTEPRIGELAAKERADPGFCSRVRDFVVGRHGFGSIKFLGETDVRRLDLESLVQFNNREVIVYMDDTKKPPVGQGLNKPAEVTLLNIKCYDRKTGQQIEDGPRIEKYKEMLKKKAEEQGAEFVSYDPVKGEWKFRVSHFSKYMLCDEDDDDCEDGEDDDDGGFCG